MKDEKGLFAEQEKPGKEPGATKEASLEFPENDFYRAWNSLRINQGRQSRLDLRRKDGSGTIIYYGYIATIEYSGNELITLIYQNSVITLRGRHLQGLREALQDERVRYIQEIPNDIKLSDGQAVVESIIQLSLQDLAEED